MKYSYQKLATTVRTFLLYFWNFELSYKVGSCCLGFQNQWYLHKPWHLESESQGNLLPPSHPFISWYHITAPNISQYPHPQINKLFKLFTVCYCCLTDSGFQSCPFPEGPTLWVLSGSSWVGALQIWGRKKLRSCRSVVISLPTSLRELEVSGLRKWLLQAEAFTWRQQWGAGRFCWSWDLQERTHTGVGSEKSEVLHPQRPLELNLLVLVSKSHSYP